jgi:hypothetical protein
VVICTDVFGLGIDVDDIEVVIQWGLCEKLMGSTLCQCIGHAARDPARKAIAVIYVQSYILDYIAREGTPEQWREAWNTISAQEKSSSGGPAGVMDNPLEPSFSDFGVVLLGNEVDVKMFGLPVGRWTTAEVSLHLRTLYRDVHSLKEVY